MDRNYYLIVFIVYMSYSFFYQVVLVAIKIEYVSDVIQSYLKYPMKA